MSVLCSGLRWGERAPFSRPLSGRLRASSRSTRVFEVRIRRTSGSRSTKWDVVVYLWSIVGRRNGVVDHDWRFHAKRSSELVSSCF